MVRDPVRRRVAASEPEVLPKVITPGVTPTAAALVATDKVPARIVLPPVKVLAPETASVPPTPFIKIPGLAEPAMTNETVLLPLVYVAVSGLVRVTELPARI